METEAKQIGAALPALTGVVVEQTDSRSLSASAPSAIDLNALPARLDDRMLAEVDQIARAPLPALPRCPEKRFFQAMFYLGANLPSKSVDEASGELRAQAYIRILGHLPQEQISYLTAEALKRCKWFPTISECLEIVGEWRRGDLAEKSKAIALVRRERDARWSDLCRKVRTGEMSKSEIEALPFEIRVRLDTENYIRINADGHVLFVLGVIQPLLEGE